MTKIQLGYFKCRAFCRCLCVLVVLHSIGFSYLSQTTSAQNQAPPNSLSERDVLIPDGFGGTKTVTAYRNGVPLKDESWVYVAGTFITPAHTPYCGATSHRTGMLRTYQHTHARDFPISMQDKDGVEITKAMVAEAWDIFFTKRYGVGQFLSRSEPIFSYNCHSFALGTIDHWNELYDSKMSDDFQLAYFHHLSTCFCLVPGTNGGFAHSLKFWAYNPGPSGTGVLGTEEKFRESQIFFHAWPITDENSPPAGTTGPLEFRGVKYKPK